MKTTNEAHICPYTGLRSFTEEESLYFKGRDLQVDQITALLEKNKFLMVTGASGEGKSSLIYAGLIPNARAGFFKAKYSNWIVADFRPERNPVTNMAISLATQFNSHPATVETELRRGYSSLIDLYTNSPFYLDEDETPEDVSGQAYKDRKRKAANLLIIVDQFEEFFTNPENFFNETLSKDSQIVVNLILETARIAIRKNLPVYIVCTMRSDYIGQCSAFRGLPEYIGFSQFFVPRLKRKDLKQVIEEPALLSGIRISQRLIERLVFDIAEGVDQLPILQHALSRIWIAAGQGSEELDLIHYAMVGGMSVEELPDENIPSFQQWFKTLPEAQQRFYRETGLSKIIEIHANLLYENSWESYNRLYPGNEITQQDTKRIIAISFSCLTKIDNSRAVRNRMSLDEITRIINVPALNSTVVGSVLNIYREEGNSFIRPFKTEDPATHRLTPGTVLDITHESLIRNWNKLNQWANREFEFYTAFLDFQKQMDRWKKSGKSRGYLLPVGPLSYFENWYKDCKPNTGWIMRYAEIREDPKMAEKHAEETLADTREFLKRSARKEFVTRSFMKYGSRRIASLLAVLLMLILSGFYWFNADQKKNEVVIEKVKTESAKLLSSNEVMSSDKAIYLLTAERHDSGSMIQYLQSLDFMPGITLANEIYKQLLFFNKNQDPQIKTEIVQWIASRLEKAGSNVNPEFMLTENNKYLIELAMDRYYLPSAEKTEKIVSVAENNYQTILRFYKDRQLYHPADPSELNMGLQLWLTLGNVSQDKIQALLHFLSPLYGGDAAETFNTYYMKGSFEFNGRMLNNFNGGYHQLACLYAAAGELDHVIWCFEKILESNQRDYFELPRILNSHLNVLVYLYQFGHRSEVPAFLTWVGSHTTDNKPNTILRNAVIRAGYISHMYNINVQRTYYRSTRGYLFPNICFCDRAVFDMLEQDYMKVLSEMKDPSERDFNTALNLKREVMFYSKYWFDRKITPDTLRLDGWLNQMFAIYRKMDKNYLEGTISSTMIYNGDGVRTKDIKMNHLLIYPDYRDGWFSWTYHTDYFFQYLKKNNLVDSLYKTEADLELLHFWIARAFEWKTDFTPETYSNTYPMPDSVLITILDMVEHHPRGASFDKNLLCGILANHAFQRGDTVMGLLYYRKMDLTRLTGSRDKYEYLEAVFFDNMIKNLATYLSASGKTTDAIALTERYETDLEKIFSYVQMADQAYLQNANPSAFVFLDSVYSLSGKIDYSDLSTELDFRYGQIKVLSEIGSKALNKSADGVLRNIPEDGKFNGIISRVSGIASEGNYYLAMTSIPKTLTESQDLQCRTWIILQDCITRERLSGISQWDAFDKYLTWSNSFINYKPN
jgi:energy-coupling factor transporter ATP-binding protein EcfA2